MAPTILIKFCGFIVGLHSNANNMTLSAFPGKIPDVAPEPTDESRLNWISTVLSQISGAGFLVFLLPLKLRVVHLRKNLKKNYFLKNDSNDFD